MKWIFLIGLISSLASAEIYITVSGANIKKATLALGKVHPLPESGPQNPALATKLAELLRSDLEFTNLFEFINESLYSHLDPVTDLTDIKYEEWGLAGASFALKLAYKVQNPTLVLEALLYDIPGQKKIFGTRYQYPISQYARVVHALTEDILGQLTGERGLFRSRILMVCRKGMVKEVTLSDPDGENFQQLTRDNSLTLSPSWSPDGKNILYTQYERRTDSTRRKKVVIPVLKRHNLYTGERVIISDREGMNSGAAWSPAHSRIAATLSFSGRPEIYLLSPNGAGEPEPISRLMQLRRITGEGFQQSDASLLFDVEPNWSPDAKRLVFSSARTGHPMIYVIEMATKIATQLTFAGVYNATPAWSPKGDKILFAAQRTPNGNFDLYVIDPDGNNLARLTKGDGRKGINHENPSWAPTGRHFAYASNEGGKYAVYVMTLDTAIRRRVSPSDRECTSPAWGPYEG